MARILRIQELVVLAGKFYPFPVNISSSGLHEELVSRQ